jgi:hypothetical protein
LNDASLASGVSLEENVKIISKIAHGVTQLNFADGKKSLAYSVFLTILGILGWSQVHKVLYF